jgi:hypothetical protein
VLHFHLKLVVIPASIFWQPELDFHFFNIDNTLLSGFSPSITAALIPDFFRHLNLNRIKQFIISKRKAAKQQFPMQNVF